MSTTSPEEGLPPGAEATEEGPGIDLIAVLAAVISEWRFGLLAAAIVAVVCALAIFSLKPQFVATASILPQETHANTETIASLFSPRSSSGLYIDLLRSRSVQDATIDGANLLQSFKTTSHETAREILSSRSTFIEGADSIVTISVKDPNAQEAALIANAYLQGLEHLNETMSLEQSKQTRSYFEHQLQQEKDELSVAETNLERTQRQTGVVQPEAQTQIGLNAIASTQAQIQGLESQLASLLQGATEQNPQVRNLRSQINALRQQELGMEEGGKRPMGAAPSAGLLPQTNLDLARAQREVHYHDVLVNSLATQFETARLNGDSARPAFQVIDRAIAPEHKDWPPRKPFLLISLVFAFVAGLLAVVCRLTWRRIVTDPAHRGSLLMLRRAVGSR